MGTKVLLERVAEILGIPVEAFFDNARVLPENDLSELLDLWAAVANPSDRQMVLRFLWGIVDRQRLGEAAE